LAKHQGGISFETLPPEDLQRFKILREQQRAAIS
jgi:hypothetical protein